MNGELLLAFSEDRIIVLPKDLPFFENPRNDNEVLLSCQHDWLVGNDRSARDRLWILAYRIARRMITAKLTQKGVTFDDELLHDKAVEAVEYVLRRYEYGWYVRKAYLRAIKWGVVHALFHRTKAQELEVLVDEESMNRLSEPKDDGPALIEVEGMTRDEAVAKVRAELLPEIADRVLEKINIVGGKHDHTRRAVH